MLFFAPFLPGRDMTMCTPTVPHVYSNYTQGYTWGTFGVQLGYAWGTHGQATAGRRPEQNPDLYIRNTPLDIILR